MRFIIFNGLFIWGAETGLLITAENFNFFVYVINSVCTELVKIVNINVIHFTNLIVNYIRIISIQECSYFRPQIVCYFLLPMFSVFLWY